MTADRIVGKIVAALGLAALEADQFHLVHKQNIPFHSEKPIPLLPEKPKIIESKLQGRKIRNSLPR